MKVRIKAVEYYPVFEIEELKQGEKEDKFTATFTSNEVKQMRITAQRWEQYQEKLRRNHPWF